MLDITLELQPPLSVIVFNIRMLRYQGGMYNTYHKYQGGRCNTYNKYQDGKYKYKLYMTT